VAGFAVVAAVLLLGAALVVWSGATLATDPLALARVAVEPFGGRLQTARALDPKGQAIPLGMEEGRLTPKEKLAPGTRVTVEVTMKRPGWSAWLIGKTKTQRLTVTAPVADVKSTWVAGSPVHLDFSQPVTSVAYSGKTVDGTRSSVDISPRAPAGTLRVKLAARTWEKLGPSTTIHYFPKGRYPVALVSPAPGGKLDPGEQIRLTFAEPVSQALGKSKPKLTPSISGHWKQTNDHTLLFTPSGTGAALGTSVKLSFGGKALTAASPTGRSAHSTHSTAWSVPEANPLRIVQLLGDLGYLPVKFDGPSVGKSARAQASAAADPPAGKWDWRFNNTPKELKAQWAPETDNVVVRGAIMKFEDTHGMTPDGLIGPDLWKALTTAEVKGQGLKTSTPDGGYSYVYVHRDHSPQTMTLWHNGKIVLTSPGNTGVAAAPTDLGTYPVFEHLAVTTMTGTNPDGSKYSDPGIRDVSYFNGGDALHEFPRASYGSPQSVGCVELPAAAAHTIWPYTPVGTLVNVES
jgi:peptidoglycan hydrolase-like protein with peptidoglycan-binding domain